MLSKTLLFYLQSFIELLNSNIKTKRRVNLLKVAVQYEPVYKACRAYNTQ